MGSSWLWFFITAFQSCLFNHVLAERLETLGRVEEGDLAYKHENGAVFLIEDAVKEQPRADRFEISPSGPLYGFKIEDLQGETGQDQAGAYATAILREILKASDA